MMKIKLIFIIVSISFALVAQEEVGQKEYEIEKEAILNTVINSIQFDSVYYERKVFFKSNELLSKTSTLKLKKKRCKVRIKEEVKGKQYLVLGDLTMPKVDPKSARVQIEILPDEILLNMRLEKKDQKWKIVNHLILGN